MALKDDVYTEVAGGVNVLPDTIATALSQTTLAVFDALHILLVEGRVILRRNPRKWEIVPGNAVYDQTYLQHAAETGESTTHTHAAGSHPDLTAHDTLGLATQAELDTHAAAADPHAGYVLESAHGGSTPTGHHAVESGESTTHTHAGGSQAFPIGSVFLAVVSTNPATLLGYGTWAQIAGGKFLVGQDGADVDFDVAEETSGAKTHTHAQHASGGAHTHDAHTAGRKGGTANPLDIFNAPGIHASQGGHQHDSHDSPSHLPPYLVLYVWKRTA